MTGEWLMVALGVVLTAGTAVFVAGEFALVTLDPATLPDEDAGWRHRSVRRGLKNLSLVLSSAQVGVTVTTILLGYTAQPALLSLFSEGLRATPVAPAIAAVLAAILGLVVVNVFSMLAGELIPKNFALAAPYGTALRVVPLLRGFTIAAKPVIVLLNRTADGILRRLGVEPRGELSSARSPQELRSLVIRSAEEGTLRQSLATLLTNSIELGELTARDVMTARMRMAVVGREDSTSDVMALARRTGHSRFPVIGVDRDDVIGIVAVRRAVGVPFERRHEVPVAALMVDAPRVPETVRLGPLLVELRSFGLQMAVVVDEYGGTSGVVTLEDVVEELVGDVADEHEPRRAGSVRAADGSWLVPGVMRPDELREATGIVVPEDPAYETLAGLIMARLGRVPAVGDGVEAAEPGLTVALTVEAMTGRRVERVRVGVVARPEAEAPR